MQKTAYEMRISDWSSDVCSSDLGDGRHRGGDGGLGVGGLLQAGADRDRGETAEGGGQGQGEQGLAGRGCAHAVSLPEARSGAASMAATGCSPGATGTRCGVQYTRDTLNLQ